MSVTELEALQRRVEATLKEQREKAENAGWDIEPGHIKQVNGEWRGVGIGRCGKEVRFALRGGKVVYSWPRLFCNEFCDLLGRYFSLDSDDDIASDTCTRVVAQLALKALGQ
jgi:hypothetical protein